MNLEKEPSRKTEMLAEARKNPDIMGKVGGLILKADDRALLPLAIEFLEESAKLQIEKSSKNLQNIKNRVDIDFCNQLINSLDGLSTVLNNIPEWPYNPDIPLNMNCIDLIKTAFTLTDKYQKYQIDKNKK